MVHKTCQLLVTEKFLLWNRLIQYIPRNMHTVFALLCFVVVIHWLIFPYPSGLLHWHCGNLTIAPVPAKQPWWIWINTSCEFIMNDCITTTKQSTTKPCPYFLGYTVSACGTTLHTWHGQNYYLLNKKYTEITCCKTKKHCAIFSGINPASTCIRIFFERGTECIPW